MPDLDGRLAALREELHDAVAVPELGSVTQRYWQRRGRRRRQVGAVLAVLVVSALVPVLRMTEPEPSPAAPPPATSPAPALPEVESGPYLVGVDFADSDHGYALRAPCIGGVSESEPESDCAPILFRTEDGESWQRVGRVPPPAAAPDPSYGMLIVLGRNELAVDWWTEQGSPGSGILRAYSDDAGRSWRNVPVPGDVTRTVQAIPAGAVLQPLCLALPLGEKTCAERTGFTVVLPDSGEPARLAGDPNLVDSSPGAIPTADGHWWVVGRRPGTQTWAVALSTDDGRTWKISDLDWQDPATGWWIGSHGDTLYASATLAGSSDDGMHAVFRSTDNGGSWIRTWQPNGGLKRNGFTGMLIVAEDGTVTATEYGAPDWIGYVSTDGGRTFVQDGESRLGIVTWTRIGYVSWTTRNYEISRDGLHWRRYEIPVE